MNPYDNMTWDDLEEEILYLEGLDPADERGGLPNMTAGQSLELALKAECYALA